MSEEVDRDEMLESREFGPPKSLQKMDNADILWKMIKKRFPNAAPLLCEMETVIDRADDLLQQLRIPCTRSAEISSLNNFVDSGESDEMISLICDESFPEDADVVEEVAIMMNTAGTQISESSISTIDTDFDSILSNQPSLSSEKFNNLKEDFKQEEHRKENNNSLKDPKKGNKKIDVQRYENEENIEEKTKSLSNSLKETVVTKIFEKVQENKNTNSSGDWKDDVKVENHYSTFNNSQDKQIHENVDRINVNEGEIFGDEKINNKTPLDILEDYANQCKIKIQYHCEKNKCNRFVITGKLSEFSATDCGDSEILVKNNIAKIILQNIADHQMNDKDMKQLLELSREQILEIINFGNDDTTIETPLRKVYMHCIKKGGSPPKYITEMKYRHEGVKFVAKCTALNHVVEGQGGSHHKAKKAAAEKFYEKYFNEGGGDLFLT